MCNWEFLLGDGSLWGEEVKDQLPTGSKRSFIAWAPRYRAFFKGFM
jgi:hypothetical protein